MKGEISHFIKTHERHLSALAMATGFIVDSLLFERVDLWQTQIVFAAYTIICFITIPLLHAVEARAESRGVPSRLQTLLPLVIQFALGGFWSGFVIFYGRSAVLGASWPFLIFLLLIFIGSEYFNKYHARLVFTSTLFFFALYSYAIFALPVYTGTIGTITFLGSGAIAIAAFVLFTVLLRRVAGRHFRADVWRIRLGALVVLILMNLFYFTNILPPLPLSSEASGVYHSVWRVTGGMMGAEEGQRWYVRYLGFAPTLHVVGEGSLSVYSAVFAPTALSTEISHEWQWRDTDSKEWITKARVKYPIVGGRDGGYRGYSRVRMSETGLWRVNIKTTDGRIVERVRFLVERVSSPPTTRAIQLK